MGLVKTRRLAAMHPPSRCALRRTGKQQRAIHLRRGYGGLKAGMKPPVKKGGAGKGVPRQFAPALPKAPLKAF